MDRRYEGNLINASENKKRVRITTSAKHAAPIIFFFLSRGDTNAELCIKSLQKPHKVLKRETLICLLLPMHLIIPQCDFNHSSPFVPLYCFLWFSIQARVHWARLWCLLCCSTRTSQNMVKEACFLFCLLHGKYSVYWKIHSAQFKNLSEWPAKSK